MIESQNSERDVLTFWSKIEMHEHMQNQQKYSLTITVQKRKIVENFRIHIRKTGSALSHANI